MNARFTPAQSRIAQLAPGLGVEFGGLAVDSRKVKPGDLFLALPGARSDGRLYIRQAIAAGAAAVVWERRDYQWDETLRVPNHGVADLQNELGAIADEFYGHPSRYLWMAGVTGTNGKTSCSHWIAQSLSSLGRKTAVLGTLGSGFTEALQPALNTTPDPIALHARLAEVLADGAQACAMEVSSHGIVQGRVNGVDFDAALFTNLSRDHLDYHQTMEDYAAAKARLFRWPGLKHAAINIDDPFGRVLAASLDRTRLDVLEYGIGQGDIAGHKLDLSARGLKLEISTPWGMAHLVSPMIGGFNASNLLGVLAVLVGSGVPLQDAIESLSKVEAVPGRVQMVREPDAPLVVVDYAHTPDALEQVLSALRALRPAGAKLFCVFGCGGDRDPGKRPLMGEVATRLADHAFITSDNPRSENPLFIIESIAAGARSNRSFEPDRAAAIAMALQEAQAADIVLIAGKGHETYQEVQGIRLPFDDAKVAREILGRRTGRASRA
jgi:UDP-N-acetylmuramyl-tripeptide synthetase